MKEESSRRQEKLAPYLFSSVWFQQVLIWIIGDSEKMNLKSETPLLWSFLRSLDTASRTTKAKEERLQEGGEQDYFDSTCNKRTITTGSLRSFLSLIAKLSHTQIWSHRFHQRCCLQAAQHSWRFPTEVVGDPEKFGNKAWSRDIREAFTLATQRTRKNSVRRNVPGLKTDKQKHNCGSWHNYRARFGCGPTWIDSSMSSVQWKSQYFSHNNPSTKNNSSQKPMQMQCTAEPVDLSTTIFKLDVWRERE